MKYIPALDGVRGIAIIIVMLFHLNIPGFSLGWAGVPLFFVLSGYLITSILCEEKSNDLYSYLRSFYIKRSLRIFPLFYAYLAINFIILFFTGRSTEGFGWHLLYLQNYYIGFEVFKGTEGKLPGIVGHTWSLAVEEQFYLIWPFVVYFLNKRQLVCTCIFLIIIAPLTRWGILQIDGNVYLANVTLPSCMDMMAYGALLSLLRDSKFGNRVVSIMFLAGCLMTGYAISTLGISAFWEPRQWVMSGFYLFTAFGFIFGMPIWLVSARPNSWIVRIFTLKPLLFSGKISYGLYIWHLIVFVAMEKLSLKFNYPGINILFPAFSLIVVYLIATASFYFFEIHFLKLKDRFALNKH